MDAEAPTRARRVGVGLVRLGHLIVVLALFAAILLPTFPNDWPVVGPVSAKLAHWGKQVSFKQSWRMYAPNPQRSQTYMRLVADYPDGSTKELEDSYDAEHGWGTHWWWNKTRRDIWRAYVNFKPKKRNDNRVWYLRGVCVRESRTGQVPEKITMFQVKRRFTPPAKVAHGAPALGKPEAKLVTVQYCKARVVRDMIIADAARRGVELDVD